MPLLWWTIARLVVSDRDGRRHNSEMEPQEKTASPHQWRRTTTSGPEEDHSRSRRSNGWAECREKNIGIEPMENTFLLTSLLIGHSYRVESRGSDAENKLVTTRALMRFRGPQALTDMDGFRARGSFCGSQVGCMLSVGRKGKIGIDGSCVVLARVGDQAAARGCYSPSF